MEHSPEDIAILLFTSGTTGDPKAAVLRHRHLASYVITTVDFMSAGEDEAALVSVPPYHVAGTSVVITGVYAGRRVVYLPNFTPEDWVATARDESVTQAMVVPTMLGRVLDLLEREGGTCPTSGTCRTAAAGCRSRCWSEPWSQLPHVDFVKAYGLTETSSTIAVLGPDDHRIALAGATPPCAAASAPSASRCRRSRSRSAIPTERRWRREKPARSGSEASRSPASTSAGPTSPSTAGSRRTTRGRSTPTATSTSRAGWTT